MHACFTRGEPRLCLSFFYRNHIAPCVPRSRQLTQEARRHSDQLVRFCRVADHGAQVLWQRRQTLRPSGGLQFCAQALPLCPTLQAQHH